MRVYNGVEVSRVIEFCIISVAWLQSSYRRKRERSQHRTLLHHEHKNWAREILNKAPHMLEQQVAQHTNAT